MKKDIGKQRTNVEVDIRIYKKFVNYCKKNHVYLNAMINKVISENIDEMNNMDVSIRYSNGNERFRMQLILNKEDYLKLERPRSARIERLLDIISED